MSLIEEFKNILFPLRRSENVQSYRRLKPKKYYHAEYTDFSTTVHIINIEKITQACNNKENTVSKKFLK